MKRLRRSGLPLALGAVVLLVAGCTRGGTTPEDEIRATIKRGEQAARDKDLDTLMSLVAESYGDDEGHTKPALKGMIARYFLASKSIHTLTRIRSIKVTAPARAKVKLFSALAGTEIGDVSILPSIRAEMFRFDLDFQKNGGQWQVASASWGPATMDDFVGE